MEPSIHMRWTFLVVLLALRATPTNGKNKAAQEISFLPANTQDLKMFVDFSILQQLHGENALSGNITLRFRSWKSDALIFYCHDQLRNFAQFQLQGGHFLFKYNDGDTVVEFLSSPYVNDGKWHSVHIGSTVITIDGKMFYNPHVRGRLPTSSYSRTTTLRLKENIRLLKEPQITYSPGGIAMNPVSVLVGAVAPGMGQVLPFVGCLSQLRIGAFEVNLAEAVGRSQGRVVRGCDPGCARSSCQNGGRCLEMWNGKHQCYCWANSFVGKFCNQTVSTAMPGYGGVLLQFPLARSVPVIGGKFGLMTLPRPGDLIVHIDGSRIDVLLSSGDTQEIYLIVRHRSSSEKESRISVSLVGRDPPFLIRFWLWSASSRIQLQLNDHQPVLGKLYLPEVRAEKINIGDPTSINRRVWPSETFRHFKGCLYNFQIFMKGSDNPIELSDTSISHSPAATSKGQCPPFVKAMTTKEVNNTVIVGSIKENSEEMKWTWYRVVIGICGAMLFCLFIVAIIYVYHSYLKRSRKHNYQKGTYSQLSYKQPSTVERPNGILRRSLSPAASPQHSVASTHLTNSTPYKIPYRPPYVATSLVIRDGKHMAHIDSDVDLESELQ